MPPEQLCLLLSTGDFIHFSLPDRQRNQTRVPYEGRSDLIRTQMGSPHIVTSVVVVLPLESNAVLQPLATLFGSLGNVLQSFQPGFGKGGNHGHDGSKVKVRVRCHLLLHAISQKDKGQIQNGTGMAAIHDARHGDTTLQRGNERFEDIIVPQNTRRGVIQRTKGFIFAIFFVSIVVANGAAVSRIVDKASVARLRLRGQVLEGCCGCSENERTSCEFRLSFIRVCSSIHRRGMRRYAKSKKDSPSMIFAAVGLVCLPSSNK